MKRSAASLAFCTCLLGISPVQAQDRMLAPPDAHYFTGKKSWGKDLADQWGLHRIGFDASPQSAWRLVKADAQPVIVAIVDSGLDWNHKHINWNSLWRNPKELEGNGVDDDKNRYVDDIIGWDFLDHNNLPWDYDGHGTFIAGDWNEKSGLAGVNPFARLMILRALNDFGHTRASVVAEAIAYAADNGARPLYRYKYLWSDQVYVGVMAQEVADVAPDAVVKGDDGYLRVDYARLGTSMKSWEQWSAERGWLTRAAN